MAKSALNLDSLLNDFREEYSSSASVRRYSPDTAGAGISYLLDHAYGDLYLDVIAKYLSAAVPRGGLRIWEFGCGTGMNLLHLVQALEVRNIPVETAIGTDFSPTLIAAAQKSAGKILSRKLSKNLSFLVARNEGLVGDAGGVLGVEAVKGEFHLMLGVNTVRYCHRLGTAAECARGIHALLAPGGVCVVIDMNRRFPAFRSRLRDALTKDKSAYRLPSLAEYAHPFEEEGFQTVAKRNFCWIPHSAGPAMLAAMRFLTPLLNVIAPDRAMRSLVVARKAAAPAEGNDVASE